MRRGSQIQRVVNHLRHGLRQLIFPYCSCILSVVLLSCAKSGDLPNEKRGSEDLAVFIFSEIGKYGGTNVPAAQVSPSGIRDYRYSEDKDGFQVLCNGNTIDALLAIFQQRFGSPSLVRTNTTGPTLFVYSVKQTGLAVNCAVHGEPIDESTNVSDRVTQLAVVRQSAL